MSDSSIFHGSLGSSDVENSASVSSEDSLLEDASSRGDRRRDVASAVRFRRRHRPRRLSAAEVAAINEAAAAAGDTADDTGMCGLTELVHACLAKSSSSTSNDENHMVYGTFPIIAGSLCNASAMSRLLAGTANSSTQPFLRGSLFTGVPPTIRFYTKGTKVTKPTRKITSRLTWCHNSLLPIVMRQTLAASHFTVVDETLFHIGYWGRHLKSSQYKTLKPYQKVNHFPGAFHIGRKDRLWMHILNQQKRFGEEFDIMPFTYLLPDERDNLVNYLEEDANRHVILKPPASARGTGIQVTRKQKDFAPTAQLVAQHYIDRPLTINNAKFDLRLYAYVPTLEPLRVYLYDQGLVRFASLPYSKCLSTLSNKYMHLTNYSINKKAEEDGVADQPVPKWTLTHLWQYFENRGEKSEVIREKIENTIIKAFIACEKPVREHMARYVQHGFICHELFGIDILLDEDLKPWLFGGEYDIISIMKVNISPSLHSGTPLDISVKAPLAKDVLNMAGIYVPPEADDMDTADYSTRPRNGPKGREQIIKEASWVEAYRDELGELNPKILKRLTAEDTRMLVEFEDELKRCGDFKLIFPTAHTQPMLRYFAEPLYANLLLQQWQIEQEPDREVGISRLERLCRQGHLRQQIEIEEKNPSFFDATTTFDAEKRSTFCGFYSQAPPEPKNVEEITQALLREPPSRLPGAIIRLANGLKFRMQKDGLDPGFKSLLDKSSAQLYHHCADNYDFPKLCEAFGLPDYMSSWYKLTLMHIWMALMSLHNRLEGQAYLRLQRGMLSSMWLDVDSRLAIIGQEENQVLTSQSDMKKMHGLHLQTFFEYDEGFLKDDKTLAGAVWRCLYMQREADPIHILRVVHYLRATVAWLETRETSEILAQGISEWKQVPALETS
ncbi:unnamed protein product [Caenorhabditis auriculariae]|uniref:Ubiquinol-cytochrome c chaperone domain-containing protein n=1 Tax=Caenorhabditis auriculariae TaxID=2777116 RepID=A0A8S1GSL8_9PELO|nr:unnamed protein product [Caenorhabditis auriculariae]